MRQLAQGWACRISPIQALGRVTQSPKNVEIALIGKAPVNFYLFSGRLTYQGNFNFLASLALDQWAQLYSSR